MITEKIPVLLLLAFVCAGQQQSPPQNQPPAATSDQSKTPPQQQQAKPAPLFGGSLGIKSSDRSKESATLGFNGIDPSGKVDAKMLAATPSADDQAKVKALASIRPSPGELDAFLREGELRKK